MANERDNELLERGRVFRIVRARRWPWSIFRKEPEVWNVVILHSSTRPGPKADYPGPHVLLGRIADFWAIERPKIRLGGVDRRGFHYPSPDELKLSPEEMIEKYRDRSRFRGILSRLKRLRK